VNDSAFGHVFGSSTLLYAAPEKGQDTENLPNDYILIRFSGDSAGTYPWGIDSVLFLRYDREGVVYFPHADGNTSVTVDTYGDVGDTIGGTFTAYLKDQATGTSVLELTDGVIKVKRLEDNSESWP
jgi:hypothetical protein